MSNFSKYPMKNARETELLFYDKKLKTHNNITQTENILKESKSFTKNAEEYFTNIEENFHGIVKALLQTKGLTQIIPQQNLAQFYDFIAMEISRPPQSIKILSEIVPDINYNVHTKSESISGLIPNLSYSLEHYLKWSFWVYEVPFVSANDSLYCPDAVYVCSSILCPSISYMLIPISYSHCIIGVKNNSLIKSGGLSIFDRDLINFLSYTGSERFFVVDVSINQSNIIDPYSFAESVRNNSLFYSKYSIWTTHPVLQTKPQLSRLIQTQWNECI